MNNDQTYQIAVKVIGYILVVLAWFFTLGLVFLCSVLVLMSNKPTDYVLAFACAWFAWIFYVYGKSDQMVKNAANNQRQQALANAALGDLNTWARLGVILENLPQGYAVCNVASNEDGPGGYWIIRNFGDQHYWHFISPVEMSNPDVFLEALEKLNCPLPEMYSKKVENVERNENEKADSGVY